MIFGNKQVKLSENFRVVRIGNNKTLEYVSTQIGVSKAYCNAVETGKKKPSDNYVAKFCELFGVKEKMFKTKTAEIKISWK